MDVNIDLKSLDYLGTTTGPFGDGLVSVIVHFDIHSELGVQRVSVQSQGSDLDAAVLAARNRLVAWAAAVQRRALHG